ncbi:MAG TPA: response regulator transcription factor [Gaiellaceae bacterium]|nr:response regulator transcription factor [Gaiellaceae bacterium]
MDTARATTGVADGYQALATGDWEGALAAFDAALDAGGDIDPDALDGRGRALWWLRDAEGAVASRERAYAGFRREGDLARAARLALWLGREYSTVWGNEAAAGGWMARAERLLQDTSPGAEHSWLALARSERATDAAESMNLAASALEGALAEGDVDLEIRALAQLGLANVAAGHLDEGLGHLDEAMAAASAGEATSLETFADVCCTLMLACDLAGDDSRPQQWSQVVDAFLRRYEHVPLLAFCRTCCADVYAGTGQIDEAEQELVAAIRELTEAGQRSRCAHPASKLAAIRVLQGRLEEADELLRGLDGSPETVEASAALRLARGEPTAAAALLERRLDELGWSNLVGVPLLALLVQARLALDDHVGAKSAADTIAAITVGRGRSEAAGKLARGRVAAALGDANAEVLLADAAEQFARVNLPLDSARARLELARALGTGERELAVDVARRAHRELEELGADSEAAAAAALIRSFGAKSRSGARAVELLTKREEEVLRLLGEGLSNGEIASRLYISPKTAEHHVGRVLRKLDLRSRAEAAAYAVRTSGAK